MELVDFKKLTKDKMVVEYDKLLKKFGKAEKELDKAFDDIETLHGVIEEAKTEIKDKKYSKLNEGELVKKLQEDVYILNTYNSKLKKKLRKAKEKKKKKPF